MTHDNRSHLDRRTVLKSSGIALAGLGGLTMPVVADEEEEDEDGEWRSLLDGPAEYQLFWSGYGDTPNDADEVDDFGYPGEPDGEAHPFLASEDPDDTTKNASKLPPGLFDGSDIEQSPGGRLLRHTFKPLGGQLMKGDESDPYLLTYHGKDDEGVLFKFVARGMCLDFEAKTRGELIESVGKIGGLKDGRPIFQLAGGSWHAQASEVIYLLPDENGQPGRRAPFSVTRVDFYDKSVESMPHALSILYVIYPNKDGPVNPADPNIQDKIPPIAHATGLQLIQQGVGPALPCDKGRPHGNGDDDDDADNEGRGNGEEDDHGRGRGRGRGNG